MKKFHKHRLVLNQGSVGIRSSTLFSCSFLAGVFWFEWTCLANLLLINWGLVWEAFFRFFFVDNKAQDEIAGEGSVSDRLLLIGSLRLASSLCLPLFFYSFQCIIFKNKNHSF